MQASRMICEQLRRPNVTCSSSCTASITGQPFTEPERAVRLHAYSSIAVRDGLEPTGSPAEPGRWLAKAKEALTVANIVIKATHGVNGPRVSRPAGDREGPESRATAGRWRIEDPTAVPQVAVGCGAASWPRHGVPSPILIRSSWPWERTIKVAHSGSANQ